MAVQHGGCAYQRGFEEIRVAFPSSGMFDQPMKDYVSLPR
jgi:hypothetical protein